MSWKDYFYFTASQRRALIVLVLMILVLFLISISQTYFSSKNKVYEEPDTLFLKEISHFKSSLITSKPNFQFRNKYSNNYQYYKEKRKEQSPIYLFPFNPNTLDSVGFIKLGLKPFMAKSILKYRRKGGKFRTAEAFSKVYGLSAEQFATLEAYIQIPQEAQQAYAHTEQAYIKIVELNLADTTALKELRGIGSASAKRIIAYRNKLGGFTSVNQLKEVWGISPELLQQLMANTTVDVSQIKKIPVNKSGIDRLRNHPYINFYQAKAIYEYRKNEGKIKSLDEAKKIDDEALDLEFWARVGAYLEF